MSRDEHWGTDFFYFHLDYLKQRRDISAASLVLSDFKKVAVDVGKRRHAPPIFGWPAKVWDGKKGKYAQPALEIHVTHTDTIVRQTLFDKNLHSKDIGEVRITYIGVTDNSRPLDIEIDLTKLEALQLARSLIAAAEKIEQSEQQLEA
jgi:hypothetical protein